MNKATTDKKWIAALAEICAAKGVRNAFLSPGSRCAPLVIAFNRHPKINCRSIIDERSAAFVALGYAQQNNTPCALICTSGSALLNYAPALAEAYYAKTPLIVLSADRPHELIDQADGQALKQKAVYQNYIKASFELPNQLNYSDDYNYSDRIVNEAINTALTAPQGPVHINIPLKEPLYGLKEYKKLAPKIIEESESTVQIAPKAMDKLVQTWNESASKMILLTSAAPQPELTKKINALNGDPSLVIVSEYLSNQSNADFIQTVDPTVEMIEKAQSKAFSPELLITYGGAILSKKLKVFLRKNPPKAHWHIEAGQDKAIDTYFALTNKLNCDAAWFFDELSKKEVRRISDFKERWKAAEQKGLERHLKMLEAAPWCDLTVFKHLLNGIPEKGILHLANSTPVRYVALFPDLQKKSWTFFSNRGVSGIDGSVSTALGQSLNTKEWCTAIVGDLSFFYDSNALWNQYLPKNFRIIIINNKGGNIFRIINGPGELDELESYFETQHKHNAEKIAETYGLSYYFCDNAAQLKVTLPRFYDSKLKRAAILEISTPNVESAEWLKKYLKIENQL
ncbi:MAG: 2-succinyl-5-enolpyruvyl-6-hydroxy-3-cyclohexene-1-carboxylic-acid synthase [Chitinophagales bacterium]